MAKMRLLKWGGHIMATNNGTIPVEQWSCSLATESPDTADDNVKLNTFQAALETWHSSLNARIHPTVALEWVAFNTIDLTNGLQVNDPTNINLLGTVKYGGGGDTVRPPLGTSYRISLDNSTRNPRAKGGFFVPRTTMTVAANGRFTNSEVVTALSAFGTVVTAIETGLGAGSYVGVWSRREAGFFPSTRMRIGDVPDNISRRRNDLREAYVAATI